MAAKICTMLVLLALSASPATAVLIPQCSATIPQYLPHVTALGNGNPIVQSYRLTESILSSPAVFLQQQSALLQQQYLAHLTVQSIMAQQQRVLSPFRQLSLASTAAYWQQQQLLPFNQLAVENAYLQQQQLLPLNPLVVGNPAVFWQQQLLPFTPLAISNPAAFWQQQQLLRVNPVAAMNPATFWQQQQLLHGNPVAAMNPAAFWQQQQLLRVNPLTAMNLAALLQQPLVSS
ncbi:zein-alpha A30 [Setaria viridis]|uniref:zein-alpha A30 n=1 Tax=Setaria viridis TaxID=4556 RepID=UPI003B3B42D6